MENATARERRREKASKIGDRGVLRGEVTGDSLKLLGMVAH